MSAFADRLRRIVTENGADGRSHVAIDGPPDPVLEFAPGDGLYQAWSEDGEHQPDLSGISKLCPLPGGVKLRWFTVNPVAPDIPKEILWPAYAQAFRTMSDVDVQPDTTRHPGMHLTRTLDFIIVVRGRVRLVLDDDERTLGPGDVVVQRATNHAWACEGDEPALLVAVLIDRTA